MPIDSSAPSTPADPDWLSLGQASKRLGVTPSTIRKWSDQGQLPVFYTPGGHRRFRERDLEAFVARSSPGGGHHGELVLLAPGDPGVAERLRVQLGLQGWDVHGVAEIDELAAPSHAAPEAVLLDLAFPDADGWQLLRRLQQRHGSLLVLVFDSRSGGEAVEDAGTLLAQVARLSRRS